MISQSFFLITMIINIPILISIFSIDFFSFLDKNERGRISNLDGLRFILSIFVVYHHTIFNYHWLYDHSDWSIEGYPINQNMGRFAVAIFFMLSAYLMTAKNISETKYFIKFYINRFFRIAPMYWLSSTLCILTAIFFGTHTTLKSFLQQFVFWFDAGFFDGWKPDFNGFHQAYLINAGVAWTLFWEWFLYISLPIIIILRAKINSFSLTMFLIFCCTYLFCRIDYILSCYLLCFACGFMARDLKGFLKVSNTIKSIIILVCLFLILATGSDPLSLHKIFLDFVLFFCVCEGGDIFGLLNCKGAIRLGEVSYSVYLLHSICLFYMNKMLIMIPNNNYLYQLSLSICYIFICFLYSITYALI